MILKETVKWTAEQFIRSAHAKTQNPEVRQIIETIMKPPHWTKWIELLHIRVNELDLAGYIRSRYALDQFVKSATLVYADKQIELLIKRCEERERKPTQPEGA